MKIPIFLLTVFLIVIFPAPGQSAVNPINYFPDENELGNMLHLSLNSEFEDSAKLSKVSDGKLISDVGFLKYISHTYSAKNSSLMMEVVELVDARAAYSLLTLLRKAPIQNGQPGDAHAMASDSICFAQGRRFVRINSRDLPKEIQEKAAAAASKRLGTEHGEPPSLISHLPKPGYDASSLRYFPAISAYGNYVKSSASACINTKYDMEIAQARYFVNSRSGIISLLKFPTPELAEEYYAALAIPASSQLDGLTVYVKRAGPLIACLEGNFDPQSADKLLNSVKFSYSVRWVFDKANNTKIIWGIPLGVLGAVVNSLFFVAILCVVSMLIGAIVAVVRFYLRTSSSKHSTGDEEETYISRLRL
jgi:hypothetical protein